MANSLPFSTFLSLTLSLSVLLYVAPTFTQSLSRLVAIALSPFEKHCHHLIVIKMCLSCCCCVCMCIRTVCCSLLGFYLNRSQPLVGQREKCAWRGVGCVTPMPLPFRFMFCCVTWILNDTRVLMVHNFSAHFLNKSNEGTTKTTMDDRIGVVAFCSLTACAFCKFNLIYGQRLLNWLWK